MKALVTILLVLAAIFTIPFWISIAMLILGVALNIVAYIIGVIYCYPVVAFVILVIAYKIIKR